MILLLNVLTLIWCKAQQTTACGPNLAFYYKTLLKHSNTYSFTYHLWLLSCYNFTINSLQQTTWTVKPKVLTIWLLTENICPPWFRYGCSQPFSLLPCYLVCSKLWFNFTQGTCISLMGVWEVDLVLTGWKKMCEFTCSNNLPFLVSPLTFTVQATKFIPPSVFSGKSSTTSSFMPLVL